MSRVRMFACAWLGAAVVTCSLWQATLFSQEPSQSPPADQAAPAAGAASDKKEPLSDYELMRIFVDTFEQIDRNYVKDVDRRQLVEAAVRGMLAELDPYSNYINPEEMKDFSESLSQEFGGVGIRVDFDRSQRAIKVLAPIPGSPAFEAGIHAGDLIVEIEGKKVEEFPANREVETATDMLRGKAGEKVRVGVRHTNSEDIEQLTLTRETINVDTVLGDVMRPDGKWQLMLDQDKKIGYIRLTQFARRSPAEMREAIRALRRDGMQALILDLRTNPGGLLDAAVEIADMFIERGVIVSTDGRNSQPRTWSAKPFGTYTGFPMAVLINNYSASASEILSAALQDHKRAVVVGQRSFGKGSVQDVIDLEDGKAALKLTTAGYHRPSGKNIHKFPGAKDTDVWGVTPDDGYVLNYSLRELREYTDDRRARDVPTAGDNKTQYVDKQLELAKKYILEQLQPKAEKPAGDAAPQAVPEQRAAG